MPFATKKKITHREPVYLDHSELDLEEGSYVHVFEEGDKQNWGIDCSIRYNSALGARGLEDAQKRGLRGLAQYLEDVLVEIRSELKLLSPELRIGDTFTSDGIEGKCKVYNTYEGRDGRAIISAINGHTRTDYEHDLKNVEVLS